MTNNQRYNEPTKAVTMRLPVSLIEQIEPIAKIRETSFTCIAVALMEKGLSVRGKPVQNDISPKICKTFY